jgi:hypothetical protein
VELYEAEQHASCQTRAGEPVAVGEIAASAVVEARLSDDGRLVAASALLSGGPSTQTKQPIGSMPMGCL